MIASCVLVAVVSITLFMSKKKQVVHSRLKVKRRRRKVKALHLERLYEETSSPPAKLLHQQPVINTAAAAIEPEIDDLDAVQPVVKKTLVLDLDETLICCVGYPETLLLPSEPHAPIEYLPEIDQLAFIRRPGLDEFLRFVATHFHLALFTASKQSYADAILDVIDPAKLISRRFYRRHLTEDQEKDISLIHPNLANVFLLDDLAECMELNPLNALPIDRFTGSSSDDQLQQLKNTLLWVARHPDVRPAIEFIRNRDSYNF